MDHEWFKTRLLDLQDAELPEEERRRILQHVEVCPSCDEQLKHWKATRHALSSLLQVSSSDAFVDQVMAKVEAIPAHRPMGWRHRLDRLVSWIPEWIYPELGLVAAGAILFLTAASLQQTPVSTEALLLNRLPLKDRWMGLSQVSDWTGSWNALSSENI